MQTDGTTVAQARGNTRSLITTMNAGKKSDAKLNERFKHHPLNNQERLSSQGDGGKISPLKQRHPLQGTNFIEH
jgi:hypothetical protein